MNQRLTENLLYIGALVRWKPKQPFAGTEKEVLLRIEAGGRSHVQAVTERIVRWGEFAGPRPVVGHLYTMLPNNAEARWYAAMGLTLVPRAESQPYSCRYCGAPSWLEPSEQSAPPDYCHESDHGTPADYYDYIQEEAP